MLWLIHRHLAVVVADTILIWLLVELLRRRLIQFLALALGDDFKLAIAAADVEWVEPGHNRSLEDPIEDLGHRPMRSIAVANCGDPSVSGDTSGKALEANRQSFPELEFAAGPVLH